MTEEYRTVTVEVRSIRKASIIVQCKHRRGTDVLARSLLHTFDDFKMDKVAASLPRELTFRVFAWKADELGLA